MSYSDLKELLIDAKNLAEGANDLQLKGKLLDIQGLIYDLTDENRRLSLKVNELENNQILESEINYRDGAYYKKNQGPFCTKCWDTDKKLVRLSVLPPYFKNRGTNRCPNCANDYILK